MYGQVLFETPMKKRSKKINEIAMLQKTFLIKLCFIIFCFYNSFLMVLYILIVTVNFLLPMFTYNTM